MSVSMPAAPFVCADNINFGYGVCIWVPNFLE